MQLKQFNSEQVKIIKDHLISKGACIVFQNNNQSNSYGLFKKIMRLKDSSNFLASKYNAPLLQKLNESYIYPKNDLSGKINHFVNKKSLQFVNDFESSNLDFVTQINPFQYDIYVKADTNTLGHQNWFYFKLLNNAQQRKTFFLNVCNLKRGFKMIKRGQKIFKRYKKMNQSQIKTSIQNEEDNWSQWQKIQQQLTVGINQQLSAVKGQKKKIYRLSFSASLSPQTQYQFSLLPPYTYSQMLRQVQIIQKKCKHAEVQTLTFSLLGLCIPIVTFTDKNIPNSQKKVVLISSRIHPGQTCGSFVARGIMKRLSLQTPENDQFFQKYILKIIPMLNPDGVVLGNFRTNYLGNDLNRCFNQDNDTIYPQVIGLKEIGKKLKDDFRQRFLCFLDLHGHSSQKSIFIYGPNYDQNHRNYVGSRFLPKTLSYLTEQFDYQKCTFNLQQCKTNTARGFFISTLKVMSFTVESSYALYDNNKDPNNKNIDLKVQNWLNFGQKIIDSLNIWTAADSKTVETENKSTVSLKQQQQVQKQASNLFVRIKRQLKKQALLSKKKITKRVKCQEDDESECQDSDGQSQSEDIPIKERLRIERKLIQGNNNHLFPRILRPAIIHPEVNPPAPLFSINKIGGSTVGKNSSTNYSIGNARIKKHRYQNIKPVNVNNAYTEYLLKQVKGLESLRPSKIKSLDTVIPINPKMNGMKSNQILRSSSKYQYLKG